MTSNCSGSGEPDLQNGMNENHARSGKKILNQVARAQFSLAKYIQSTVNVKPCSDSSNSPKKKFTLSADAPVFVPKFAMPQPEFEPVPPEAPTLYMSGSVPTQREIEEFERLNGSGQPDALLLELDNPVDAFRSAVVTLTTKGNVESYMKPIVGKLRNGVTDMAVLNEMIDILFNHSITETNFSYTGAQICKYLGTELKSHHTFSNFRSLFLNKCKSAYDEREAWVKDPALFVQLTNLSMLIGQLFLFLEDDVNGEPQKLGFLRQAISNLLLTFLADPTDDRVKTAATLLKLTGYEITKNAHLPGDFNEIYTIIRSLERHPSLNRTSHCLINSVLSRLEYNWGVGQAS